VVGLVEDADAPLAKVDVAVSEVLEDAVDEEVDVPDDVSEEVAVVLELSVEVKDAVGVQDALAPVVTDRVEENDGAGVAVRVVCTHERSTTEPFAPSI
jgi:hypothetical protein